MATIQPPAWITRDFIQKFLSDGIKEPELKVLSHDIKPAVAPGDNYASIVLRVKLEIQKTSKSPIETLSVIMKVLPPGELFVQQIEKMDIFKTESRMLGDTVPRMQKLLDQVKPGLPKLCATLYNSQGAPNYCIMMEDLCVNGFKIANRFVGADFDHCVVAMKSYARLHACSYALVKKDPSLKETYATIMMSKENAEPLANMISGGFAGFVKQAETWSEVSKSFVEKLHETSKVVVDRFLEALEFDENNLNVVVHGDCWLNNMMFQYDKNNKPIHLNFVDLQISSYNNHVMDIVYFLFTAPQLDVRVNHLDDLLKVYYDEFIRYLKMFKRDVSLGLTYQQLEKGFYEKTFVGMVLTCSFLPIMITPPSEVITLDQMIGDPSGMANSKIYQSDILKNNILALIPLFKKHNVF